LTGVLLVRGTGSTRDRSRQVQHDLAFHDAGTDNECRRAAHRGHRASFWPDPGLAGRCGTSASGVAGCAAGVGRGAPAWHRSASSFRMELQREAEHISAGNPADRAFSQAAPMVCPEVLEPHTPGGSRTDWPLNQSSLVLTLLPLRYVVGICLGWPRGQ